ncbi:ATP-binding cassette domain-containing protein [Actinoplanes sp. NPDC004185]
MDLRADDPMIVAEGLHKWYGETHALSGLDLTIPAGSVYGLLGPNGAGKTTLVRILTTLAKPDRGHARVAGLDVATEAAQVRYKIGLAGQYAALDERLTGRDNLRMFGRLYHLSAKAARARADDLLERYELQHAANRLVATYSGGMRRRLDLITSLIVVPPVLFLDEPTTGLDPRSRADIWQAVREVAGLGATVLLTTQYLEEADRLAARIAVVDTGRVIASGTPTELKALIGNRLDVVVTDPAALSRTASLLSAMIGTEAAIDEAARKVTLPIGSGTLTLTEIVRALDQADVEAEDVSLGRPSLDDVFLRLTDRSAQAGPADARDMEVVP